MSVGCEGGDISFNLQVNVDEATKELAKVNELFTMYLALANRAGLRGDIMDALRKLQQIRIALQLTLRAIQLFEAASGPVGWAIAIGTGVTAGFAMADTFYEANY